MDKMPSYLEIEKDFINNLKNKFPEIQTSTESNVYKLMYPIISELYRLNEKIYEIREHNDYRTATGSQLDLILTDKRFPRNVSSKARGYWITKDSIPTTSALQGVVKFEDKKGNTYVNTASFIVDSNGYAKIEIESENVGALSNAEANTINTIKTPIIGLNTGTNEEELLGGTNSETDLEYRARWEISQYQDSYWNTDGIYSEILFVNGVKSCSVIENDSDFAITINGTSMPSRSRRYYVDGGSDIDVAQAIYRKTDRAIEETGDVVVNVKDLQGNDREIKFNRPNRVRIYYKFEIVGTADTTQANILTQDYINNSKINGILSDSEIVSLIQKVIDVSQLKYIGIKFSRNNISFENYIILENFEVGYYE